MLCTGQKKCKVLAVLCFIFLLGKDNLINKGKKISMQKVKKTLLTAEQGLGCISIFPIH